MDLLQAQALAFGKVSEEGSRVIERFNWLPKRLAGEWRGCGRHLVLQKATKGIRATRGGGYSTCTIWRNVRWWPR